MRHASGFYLSGQSCQQDLRLRVEAAIAVQCDATWQLVGDGASIVLQPRQHLHTQQANLL